MVGRLDTVIGPTDMRHWARDCFLPRVCDTGLIFLGFATVGVGISTVITQRTAGGDIFAFRHRVCFFVRKEGNPKCQCYFETKCCMKKVQREGVG